jgi:hypothetical protein
MRLPAFCLLSLIWARVSTVMDPALHCRVDLTKAGTSGKDFGTACNKTRARTKKTRRENGLAFRPRFAVEERCALYPPGGLALRCLQ